jgi:hypothetical protein
MILKRNNDLYEASAMFSHFMIVKLRSIIKDQNSGEPKTTCYILPKEKKALC